MQSIARRTRMRAGLIERSPRSFADAYSFHNLERFALAQPSIVLELDRREHQRKGCETFEDVVPNWLANLAFGADVVEHVIGDLKGEAKRPAIGAERRSFGVVESAEQRSDLTAGRQQHRGLGLDALHVLIDACAVAKTDPLLAHLARADAHYGPSEDVDDFGHAGSRRVLIRLGKVEVANHDRRFIA